MKKFFISLILIFLAHFFTINFAYCEEDFFESDNFQQAKSESKLSSSKVAEAIGKTKKDGGFFSFFKRKSKKDEQEPQQGYYGELPDINSDFEYKKQMLPSAPQIDMEIPKDDEIDEQNLKKAPYDDSLFLDMVIKKEPDSQYLNDIQKIKFALNNLKKCIEEQGSIQRFNACVNVLELYVQNFKKKYENKSESLKDSYIDVLNTNYYAKLLGNLKYDSNYYARYIPTNQGKYSSQNIAIEENKLLDRINKTLFLLNNET